MHISEGIWANIPSFDQLAGPSCTQGMGLDTPFSSTGGGKGAKTVGTG